MIHIIIGDAAAENLKAAFELDENLRGEILVLKDTLGIGPIATDQKGHDGVRTAYWKSLLGDDIEDVMDKHRIEKLIERAIEQEEPVCLWMAPCVSDVCAYYFLLTLFKEHPGMLHVIIIDSLPFFNEKGAIFYPKNFGEVLPKEFVKTKRLLKEVTPADYETEYETWEALQTENAMVRIHKGGKEIVSADETYFDTILFNTVTKEAQKGSKIVRHALAKTDQTVSDLFLLNRLGQMARNEQIVCDEDDPLNLAKANFKKAGGSVAEEEDMETSDKESSEE